VSLYRFISNDREVPSGKALSSVGGLRRLVAGTVILVSVSMSELVSVLTSGSESAGVSMSVSVDP
jgi:hypothetical protein